MTDKNQKAHLIEFDKNQLCVCENCGHIQAEPNWCNQCGHRTSMPDWAAKLIGEMDALRRERDDLEDNEIDLRERLVIELDRIEAEAQEHYDLYAGG